MAWFLLSPGKLQPAATATLRVATWNMEWLVTAETAHRDRLACRSGRRAALPCDIARRNTRNSADFARLRYYVRQLNADIIAFQEVENAQIAADIFRGYAICISTGAALQQVGFAVRLTLPHRCGTAVQALALNNRQLRPGMTLHIAPGTTAEWILLTIHLKSGCARATLSGASPACRTLQRQVAALGAWMHHPPLAARPVVVLGDFNRQPATDPDDEFWQPLLLQHEAEPSYWRSGADTDFHNCFAGQGFASYIDHILVNRKALERLVVGSYKRVTYLNSDATNYRLSDHCPLVVELHPGA